MVVVWWGVIVVVWCGGVFDGECGDKTSTSFTMQHKTN